TVVNGVVTLLKEGTVTITATADGKSDTHEIIITVPRVLVDSVEILGPSTGLVGDDLELTVQILPLDAEYDEVTWSVNINAFANVNDGLLTLKRTGTVLVTVSVDGKTATKEVTIQSVVASLNGTNYGSMQAAINAAISGDTIIIKEGTHNESFTINKSNLTLEPEADKKVVLTNLINIATNLQNITITGFEFTQNAQFKSTGTLKGFNFTHNHIYDLTLTPNAYAPVNRINVNAFIQFYRLADSDLFGDINIESNIFENIEADIISLDRTMVN